MQNTPRGLRFQIGLFGKRNAGKSSLLNAIAGQDVSIVSPVPGTTADPVNKAMELPPLGPVLFIDTAGIDDEEAGIGVLRADRSLKALDRCDAALVILSPDRLPDEAEELLFRKLAEKNIPAAAVLGKSDLAAPVPELTAFLEARKIPFVSVSARTGAGLSDLRGLLIRLAPEEFLSSMSMLGDLTERARPVLLITPVDKEAPRGRLILPQVQAIRDVLDHSAWCVVTQENLIPQVLSGLSAPPVLAVTDSQVFDTAAALVPPSVPLTSFSILMARMKGDLTLCAEGAAAIRRLHSGSRILIAEACTHHPVSDDIGREKIPRWLRKKTGVPLDFSFVQGTDFPADPLGFDLVIHCGACTFNRRAVLSRIHLCREKGVPFTNYGVCIAELHGILERALAPFPAALTAYRKAIGQ